ncbi:MAG: suppressor of fused domain protein [Archangium sp.]
MGFLGNLFKKSPPKDAVKITSHEHADGSRTVKTEFELRGRPRPVRDDVVKAIDDALSALGQSAEVMHAMDPSRLLSFENGGPPVWSVGMVEVPGPQPYTLLVTYGLSHVLSPEDFREGLNHEYSFAVPHGTPLSPWADAFLRHQCRYVLTQGADIRVNDCVPFRGVPMTRIPFQPQHHAMMPDSTLVGMLATTDPVLPFIATPHGDIEVRRLVGIDSRELDRVETWSAKGFLEELRKVDSLLLSPLMRRSWLDDETFKRTLDARFENEGSDIDAALFDFALDGSTVLLPSTTQGRERLLNGLKGRVGFNRRLMAFSQRGGQLLFDPAVPNVTPGPRGAVIIGGSLLAGPAAEVFAAVKRGDASVTLTL